MRHTLVHLVARVLAEPSRPWALATLVRVEGSSYRRLGARLLVASADTWFGTLSGGCLEKEIAARAAALLTGGEPPGLLRFDTRRLYGCDGCVEIFIERLETGPANLLALIGAELAARRSCVVRTVFAGESALGSGFLTPDAPAEESAGVFVEHVAAPPRLVLFGQGPEIGPLHALCEHQGWECTAYAGPADFPADFVADDRTAAVVCNHNFGRDLATLARVAPLGLPYVGLLGPRRRRDEMLARLGEETAVTSFFLDTLHAPAGLDLGGESPQEIALAIVAEASAVLAGREGGFLRDRRRPIHDRAAQTAVRA